MDSKEAWRVRHLDDEPIYCEVPHDEADVLYAGSDEEHYNSPGQRKQRYEEAAIRFLQGQTPVLLSAVLKGPFEGPDAKGWVNPWRSKRKTESAAPALETTPRPNVEVVDTGSMVSCHLPSPRSLDQVGISPHPFMEEDDLERVQAWRSATDPASKAEEEPWSLEVRPSQSRSQSQRKRLSTGSDWLKRKDYKRQKTKDVDTIQEASVAVQHCTPKLLRNQSQTYPRQVGQEDNMVDDDTQSLPSHESNPRTPQKASQTGPARSARRSQVQNKATNNHQDEMLPPLSTPIQTPRSCRESKITPRRTTQEDRPPQSSNITMDLEELRGHADIKAEFETQQDESFLFRARPRNPVFGAADMSPIRRMSFGRISSPASSVPTETDSELEPLDLDGDTCMADDTKATSPESIAKDKDHETPVNVAGQKTRCSIPVPQAVTESDSEHNEVNLETAGATNQNPLGNTANDDQSLSIERETEAKTNTASQEPTIVAYATSQETQKDRAPTDGNTTSPPTPEDKHPVASQPTNQSLPSHHNTVQTVHPQSPWSKLSQFTTSSPCPPGNPEQEHLQVYNPEASMLEENGAQTVPGTSTAAVVKEPVVENAEAENENSNEPCPTQNSTRLQETFEQHESPVVRASQQSPWKPDTPVTTSPFQHQIVHEDDDNGITDPSYQSPWTASPEKMRQAAQEALMSDLFNVVQPLPSPVGGQPTILAAGSAGEPELPTAANTSSRPASPEPVFSIKSFANFLSPSPERCRRRSDKVRLSGGHLPSTQNLIAATTDNPWDSIPKSGKRVKWAPLPHEVEVDQDDEDRGPRTPTAPRAASPPPETAVADLPTGEDEQFQKHFQAVSRRTKLHRHILPSASQQVSGSPAPMAMAEAFVAADSFKNKTPSAPEADIQTSNTSLLKDVESQESALDDVDDILRNLNEFIEMVDVEADLARTKEEARQKEMQQQQQKNNQTTSDGLAVGFTFDGIMDAGVWD